MPAFFCASDLVVLPYVSVTGSGQVQLAFGFDRPVVVTNIGSLSEVVRDKITGFLVPPEAPSEIADAVVGFFSGTGGSTSDSTGIGGGSTSEDMGAAIRADRSRFSWDGLIESIEKLGNRED